jgi:Helicase conserved C-terminal domain
MWEHQPPSRHFLIADEVGLGKTIVARGLIARMIDRLWENPNHRIDIVYICSNGSIARQNLNKLNFLRKADYPIPDRITMLPQVLKDLECQRLNLVSFTPGTSFNLGSSEGRAHERALLYWLLPESWRSPGTWEPVAALMGGIRSLERFEQYVAESSGGINEGIRAAYAGALAEEPALEGEFRRICGCVDKHGRVSEADRWARATLVGKLRSVLARTCVLKLEPDLIILDEFQRFKDLLRVDDPQASLAQRAASDLADHLFKYDDARVLLLSATPYKMYTLHEESAEDDHYKDFAETVSFLQCGEGGGGFKSLIEEYRQSIFSWTPSDGHATRAARQRVEEQLKRFMVRTERLASSNDRNGMLVEITPDRVELRPRDIQQYARLQQTARLVGYGDVIEFWKSAPYVLNFMEEYDLKSRFVDATSRADLAKRLADVLRDHRGCLLDWSEIEAYRQVDPANARLRSLLAATVGRGTAALLWMPPTLPYYELAGQFADARTRGFTKHLVFSSWQVVPKVVASLVTYDAERALVTASDGPAFANTAEARKKESRLLRFSRSKGRLTGMPLAALFYPSETLATLGDPLEIAGELRRRGTDRPTLRDVVAVARERISARLAELDIVTQGPIDEGWYWAAPVLVDIAQSGTAGAVTRAWFQQASLAAKWAGEVAVAPEQELAATEEGEQPDAWQEHVEEFRKLIRGPVKLGTQPDDLVDTLALLAVAGPANVALRALGRLGLSASTERVDLRNAAGQVAAAMRSLFNDPAITAFLRSALADERYWRVVLQYCAEGCLQSVMDEYVHLLGDCGGRRGKKPTEFVKPILEALTLYSATMIVDQVNVDDERKTVSVTGPHERKRLRTSYAARFGAQRKEDAGGAERNRKLQTAFNSPFWPFVLCSTSIGQEGLDFHYYCHAVVHWNLPSNPVDLEQREGRVHRYKGHAVRKNVAERYGLPTWDGGPVGDPWRLLFQAAVGDLTTSDGGLTPFWLYCTPDGARIERHVPAMPLSLDRARADALRRSLAVYRMAFGQARQEDVVAFLQRFPREELQAASDDLRIDLSPLPTAHRDASDDVAEDAALLAAVEEIEPVWAGTADEPPEVHFGDIERLLDDFRALAGEVIATSNALPAVRVSVLSEFLDAFVEAVRRRERADEEMPAPVAALSLDVLCSLLDDFCGVHLAARRTDAVDDLLPRLQALIDQFATLGAPNRSPEEGLSETSSHA